MKTRALIAAIVGLMLYLAAGPAAAQVTWEVGFKGGVDLGKLTGDTGFSASFTDGFNTLDFDGDISDFRTGFAGGGFATARISDAFGIRFEVLYAQKGGKGSVNMTFNGTPAGTADITFKLDYVEIPVLAVGSFPAGNSARMNVFGGPSIAFKTGAKVKTEFQGQSDEQDAGDTTETTDFGFAAGAGVAIAASPTMSLVIDGRYTFGLSKVFKSGEDLKNGGLALMAGLSFPLGGGS